MPESLNLVQKRRLHLQGAVGDLGACVVEALHRSVECLKTQDKALAADIIAGDQLINQQRRLLEQECLVTLAAYKPAGEDLRAVGACMELASELERIGDYAKGIAKVASRLADDETPIPIREISTMADKATSMLHRALGAFVSEDLAAAYAIPKEDDEVDELYITIYRKIVQNMIKHPDKIDHTNQILWVIHNLERTADRVTNICERIIFIVSGELIELDSSDNEDEDV